MPKLWGENFQDGVEIIDGMSVLFEHFPAGAMYLERTPEALTLSGWMREEH